MSAPANRSPAARRLLVALAALLQACSARATTPPAAPCSAPEYRQFDFWLGDWDVFDARDPARSVARVTIEPILGGCGVLETYADREGHEGRSFSIYDASRRTWHQTWITNQGHLLIIEGGLRSGRMQLSGTQLPAYGAPARSVRGSWEALAGEVREVGERSLDGGNTWQPWFDLMFRRHATALSWWSFRRPRLAAALRDPAVSP
jgi:hypothetical protein